MKLFIDTADVAEIREVASWGIVDGPVSVEVVSLDAPSMVEDGKRLARLHKNVVVKIPMIAEGLRAVRVLAGQGVSVNVTLVFSATQALLAAKAGATFVSPFVGRLDDVGHDGMDVVAAALRIYENYAFRAQVLAASLRGPLHVARAAQLGVHAATCPFAVVKQLVRHPLTDVGLERFLADWRKAEETMHA